MLAAFEIMDQVEDLWISLAPEGSPEKFEAEVAEPLHERDELHDQIIAEYEAMERLSTRERAAWPAIQYPLCIAYGYAVLVRLATEAAANDLAWTYVEDASYWLGHSIALVKFAADADATIGEVARRAADARNAENRMIMQTAFEWLDANFGECRSMDQAAERLTKIVPVAFRTARRYVTNWKKSIPPSWTE